MPSCRLVVTFPATKGVEGFTLEDCWRTYRWQSPKNLAPYPTPPHPPTPPARALPIRARLAPRTALSPARLGFTLPSPLRLNLFRVLINVMFVTMDQFHKDAKKKAGMWADEPTKENKKLRATYDATNRRMAAAIADAKFDELLIAEGKDNGCNPCACLPFCA